MLFAACGRPPLFFAFRKYGSLLPFMFRSAEDIAVIVSLLYVLWMVVQIVEYLRYNQKLSASTIADPGIGHVKASVDGFPCQNPFFYGMLK